MSLRPWLPQLRYWPVIGLPLLAYGLLASYAYCFADRQIFLPQYANQAPLPQPPIRIPVADNAHITAVYLTNPKATYTILYSHGNAETLGDIYPRLLKFQQLGLSVVAYDYRGYGASSGQPSEHNAYADIDAVYRYTTETLKVNPDRLIVFGRSIGGGPSTYLASRKPIAGLILESTFTSVFRVVVPFPLLPFDKFPNRDRIERIQAPLLIIHGDRDPVIPFEHGEILFKSASAPKQFLRIPGAGHNDVSEAGGLIYQQGIQNFIATIAKNR